MYCRRIGKAYEARQPSRTKVSSLKKRSMSRAADEVGDDFLGVTPWVRDPRTDAKEHSPRVFGLRG
jgi:hypothetical protein